MIRLLSRRKKSTDNRSGTTTLEVAFTLPILGILLAGLMEFCHYFMVLHTLNAAARRGALIGSYQGTTDAQVVSQVQTIIAAAFNSSKASVLVCDASVFDSANFNPSNVNFNTLPAVDLTQSKTGDCFMVQASVPYNSVALLPPFWIQNKTVTGRAVMRHE